MAEHLRRKRLVDSQSAMSLNFSPCRASTLGIADTGAISSPSLKISTAAISKSTRRARGSPPGNRSKPFSVATQIAAAPSVRGELLPAVSVPRPLLRSNTGFNLASFSIDVSRRGK